MNDRAKISLKSTLAQRLTWRLSIISFTLFAVALVIVFPMKRREAKRSAIVETRNLAEAVSVIYGALDPTKEMAEAERLLLRVARAPHISYISVLDRTGIILYSTIRENVGTKLEIKNGYREENGQLIVSHVLSQSLSPLGAVVIASDLYLVFAEFHTAFLVTSISIAVGLAFLMLIIAFTIERQAGRRLTNLALVMQSAEQGFFLARAQVDTMDEIGALAAGFNKLLVTITHLHEKNIESEKDLTEVKEQLSIKEELERIALELKESNKALRRKVKAQELLMDAAHELGSTLSKNALLARLASLLNEKMGWPDFAVFLTHDSDAGEKHLRFAMASGAMDVDPVRGMTMGFGEGITGVVAQTAAPIVIDDLSKDTRLKVFAVTKDEKKLPEFCRNGSLLSVPMMYQSKVIGVMNFFSREKSRFDEEDVTLSHALGAQVALAVMNSDLYEETLTLATIDPLTGVLNRRSLERILETEIARAERFNSKFAVLMIDVDDFKRFNDQMGHLLGDAALKRVATCLKTTLRKVDTVARYGGEEFCVLLPLCDVTAAMEVAEKLCAAVRAIDVRGAKTQPLGYLSVSIGVSVYDAELFLGENVSQNMVQAADRALYQAKDQGRDRVVAFVQSSFTDTHKV